MEMVYKASTGNYELFIDVIRHFKHGPNNIILFFRIKGMSIKGIQLTNFRLEAPRFFRELYGERLGTLDDKNVYIANVWMLDAKLCEELADKISYSIFDVERKVVSDEGVFLIQGDLVQIIDLFV